MTRRSSAPELQDAAEATTGVRVPPQSDDEYVELHKQSRFYSLCPRGDAVYSFRFVEALSCGAVPVIYGDGWVLPFSELLDYHTFAVVIAEADVDSTPKVLAAIGQVQLAEMQRCGRDAFERLMSTVPRQLEAVLKILAVRRDAEAGKAERDTDTCSSTASDLWRGARERGHERATQGQCQGECCTACREQQSGDGHDGGTLTALQCVHTTGRQPDGESKVECWRHSKA